MLSQDFDKFITVLKLEFYQRLLQGQIKEAQATAAFLQSTVIQLKSMMLEEISIFTSIDEEKTKSLTVSWNEFQALFAQWQFLVKQHISTLTSEEFQKDPETWRQLLASELEKPIEGLLQRLVVLKDLSKELERLESIVKLIPFEYSTSYKDRKEKVNLYLQNQRIINRVEKKIRINLSQKPPLFVEGVSDKIHTGPWEDYLHAHLPMPLGDHRIVYSFDGKKIVFERLGTHKELKLA